VAEYRARSRGQEGGDAAPAVAESLVADGVYALVDADQASGCQPMPDFVGRQSEREELLAADNPALTGG